MGLISEFRAFISKGNVIDLAVAVVLGAAFTKIVSAVVEGVIMPIVGRVLPSGDWTTWTVAGLHIGRVLSESINFVIIAFVVFMIVHKLMKRGKAAPPAPTPEDILLLREIRDQLKTR
jgi:large conductance mechanosensitive channel